MYTTTISKVVVPFVQVRVLSSTSFRRPRRAVPGSCSPFPPPPSSCCPRSGSARELAPDDDPALSDENCRDMFEPTSQRIP